MLRGAFVARSPTLRLSTLSVYGLWSRQRLAEAPGGQRRDHRRGRNSIAEAAMQGAAGFDKVYEDINNGGSLRWKIGENVKDWEIQHKNIVQFVQPEVGRKTKMLVPLSGDCPYVKYGWEKGFHVTAVEWSSVAINNLKEQFEASGVAFTQTAEDSAVVYEAEGIRLVVADWDEYAAAALARQEAYDVIFDKDVYGFFGPVKGKSYAETACKFLKQQGFVYLEVKNRADASRNGPPFHMTQEDIHESFGASGVAVVKDFGKLHDAYGPAIFQVGYMLQMSQK